MNSGSSTPWLVIENMAKRFGATYALQGVSLSVHAGQVLALIGENGAGKSTLMKILSGAHPADSGEMTLQGQVFRPRSPVDARRAGVAMIYQELSLAKDLSVEDNIMLGIECSRLGWLTRGKQQALVRNALRQLGHPDLSPTRIVGSLSLGTQQLVEIARALVSDARLFILDEPTSSLSQHDVQRLFMVLKRLQQDGRSIIYISHFLEEIRKIAQTYVVLRDGRNVAQGSLEQVSDSQLITSMVGRKVDELFPKSPHTLGEIVLEVKGLTGCHYPRNVTLEIRRGEVFGVFGLIGAGRTETLRQIFGLDARQNGSIRFRNHRYAARPSSAIATGIGMVSEDRKNEGLALGLSINDNLSLSHLKPYSHWGWIGRGRRRKVCQEWMQRFQVKAKHSDQAIGELSGGNQQKIAIARVLHQQAELLLLDEPTRGVDVNTKAEIYRWIGELAAAGKAIVFVSSYLPELIAISDTLAVMSRGSVQEIRPTIQWTESEILAAAIGARGSDDVV